MKKKDRVELTSKSEKELLQQIMKLKEEMGKETIERFSGKAKAKKEYGNNKRQIARILTILKEKKGEEK
jgi:ribosomal protein L29